MITNASRLLNRRSFLRSLGATVAAGAISGRLLADQSARTERVPWSPVRVRGAVRIGGTGAGRIAVSDGRNVALTDPDGTFTLLSDSQCPFVFVSLPAAAEIPVSARGSSALFRPIVPDAGGESSAVFELARSAVSGQNHGFLVLADPQLLDLEDVRIFTATTVPDVRKTTAALSALQPFGVGCGDLMFENLTLFPEYESAVQQMGLPFFQVIGNHDVDNQARTDDLSVATFLRTFGPTNYSFNRGEIHYVVLDDVFWIDGAYIGYLSQEQLDWLEADLRAIEKGRRVVVFVHIPVYDTQHIRAGSKRPEPGLVVTNRDALYEILAPYNAHIVAGHMHESEHLKDGKVPIHVAGAVCGSWWTGSVCGDGTPKGYAVYEVNGENLKWRYKATGMPDDLQMRLYGRGSDPAAPAEIIANVWDWDPSWNLVWYEDGVRKGKLEQRRGLDPLATELYAGPELPRKHTWAEPWMTDHLFRSACSPSAKEILVEATDGFGRVYTAKCT